MVSTYFQTVDILNVPSRNFYERAKAKQTAALYLGAVGMMFLGFCSETAGKANMQAFLSSNTTGTQKQIATDLAGGYGFASFCYIVGSIFCLALAMYISPFSCGSTNEKKILTYPADIYSSPGGRPDTYVQPQSM